MTATPGQGTPPPGADDERGRLTVLLDQCERIVQVHERLRMDTPADEALRMDVVATTRAALDQCRAEVEQERGISLGAPGVLWMALRYALGRRTYAVGEACNAILENLPRLTHWQADRMAGEIEQELEWAAEARAQEGVTAHYADDLDRRWRETAAALRAHAEEARDA